MFQMTLLCANMDNVSVGSKTAATFSMSHAWSQVFGTGIPISNMHQG